MAIEEGGEENHEEGQGGNHGNAHLIVVFHIFVFVLLAAFIRQIGLKLRFKFPAVLLYFAGMVVGVYFVQFPKEKIYILNVLGTHVLRRAYTPAYFFLGTFNMESEFIHKRALPHAAACAVVFITTTATITILCVALSEVIVRWNDYLIMAMIVFSSDLKIIKHFMEASHSFSSKEIFILLELESLVASVIASIARDMFHHGNVLQPDMYLTFFIRIIFTCSLAFFVGKFTAASIDRMHHDSVNQTTSTFVAMLFTHAGASVLGASGDLAVVTLGFALLGAKPGFSPVTVTNINRFIEAYRYVLVGCIQVVGGILFTLTLNSSFTRSYIMLSGFIYLTVFGCRFVIIIGFWVVFRHVYQLTFVGILTICAFNIKSIFSLVLTMSLLYNIDHFKPEREHLFIIANIQIFLSTVLTKPMASLIFTIQDGQTVVEKYAMVLKALERINENKESTIRSCRSNQFTADADWTTVQHTTSVENGFFKRFATKAQLKKMENAEETDNEGADETQLKADAVKDLLRLQKRLLEEQFRHGTLSGRSAKQFSHFLGRSMHKSMMMSTQQIIDGTGPNKLMQITIRDLIRAMQRRHNTNKVWIVLITSALVMDMFLNVYNTIAKMFMFADVNNYIPAVTALYGLLMAVVGIAGIIKTGSRYLHTVSSTLWNWLAWLFTFSSFLAFGMDYFSLGIMIADRRLTIPNGSHVEGNLTVYYVVTLLASVIVLLRSLILACTLFPVQNVLFRMTSSMLHTCIYNQCDGCYGFLQVLMDTHKRLKNRGLDPNIELGASNILHQESLAMRQFLGVMEVLTPEVMAALRTRVACRLILTSQERVIEDLVEDGVLESKELDLLTTILRRKHRDIECLSTTLSEPPNFNIIRDIPWVVMGQLSHRDIVSMATTHHRAPGDVLVEQGEKMMGLIVILRGLVRMEMASNFEPTILFPARRKSSIYIKDRYFIQQDSCVDKADRKQHVELSDFYSRGNVIGEFGMLIDKAEHKSFRCVTDVEVLIIPNDTLVYLKARSLKMNGPMNLLEYSMWTTVAIRQAARLILWNASYQLLTRCHVYMVMEDSYILDCDEISQEDMEKMHKAVVVLIYGEVVCPVTELRYYGPVILPVSLIDAYWRRSSRVNKSLRGKRNVLLVIPRHKLLMQGGALKPLDVGFTRTTSETDVSLMTISSGSSDGIPYRHYHHFDSQLNVATETLSGNQDAGVL